MDSAHRRARPARQSRRDGDAERSRPLRLSDLRLGRRRQVDPDRPSAVRAETDLRRPARGARARLRRSTARPATTSISRCCSTGSRPSASRASPSTSPIAIFATDAALLHRRRHARPRAVYPQHGDRRLERRSRGHAGRRAQGPADADPPARDHRLAARHPPRRAGGQQDRPGRLRPGGVREDRRRFRALRRDARASEVIMPIPMSARYGDNVVVR